VYGGPFKDEFHSRLRFSHRCVWARQLLSPLMAACVEAHAAAGMRNVGSGTAAATKGTGWCWWGGGERKECGQQQAGRGPCQLQLAAGGAQGAVCAAVS
jgi:hypothetical protein